MINRGPQALKFVVVVEPNLCFPLEGWLWTKFSSLLKVWEFCQKCNLVLGYLASLSYLPNLKNTISFTLGTSESDPT
jgi:hypothetical protein